MDPSGPAFVAGLKENDLITHIGGQSIQGMAHTEVVYLIIQSRDQLVLQATPLQETSIKNGLNIFQNYSNEGIHFDVAAVSRLHKAKRAEYSGS